jgi:hypothetical protein
MSVEEATQVPEPLEVKEPEHDSSKLQTTGKEANVAFPNDESVHDISYHPGRVVLYSPPQQRQKWGESQFLPR